MEFVRQKRFWTGLGIFLLAAAAVAAYAIPPWPSLMNWVFDLLAFAGALVAGLMLISQFVLPVQTMRERRAVFDHFMQYVSGNYGPIIFVKDGKIVGRKEELKRYGPGVALVDPVSAIVIERAAARHWAPAAVQDDLQDEMPAAVRSGPALVRAAGPGIDFIAPGERIVAALDLRRQSRGAPAKALTRDGIECSAFVSVTFGLDPDPDHRGPNSGKLVQSAPTAAAPAAPTERNQPAYRFHRGSGFKAVYGVALGEKQPVDWTELPLIVAVERFRDALSEFRLDELFEPTKPDVYPFATFQARVVGLVKDAPVLRERGLIVYGVGLGSFSMPRAVLNQRIRSWQARWQKATIQQEAAAESQALRTESRWQIEAQTMIFENIQALMGATHDPVQRRALALMLVKALRRAAADPRRRQALPAETLRVIESLGEPSP